MAIGRPIEQTPNIADKVVTATATAGQTEFTVTGGYRINHLAVFRNGVRLVNGNDFTALDGTTVTLLEDAANLDVLEFQVFDSFSVSDALLTNAASQTVNGDVTVNGTFTVGSGGIGTFTAAEVVVGIVSSTTGITTVQSLQAASSTTTGALQVKGGVGIGKSLYVGGNVSVGGTLTYEDVTNVDSVGLVTAGKGVRITTGGLVVTAGVSTFAGITTVTNTAALHSKQLNVSAGSTFGGAVTASDTLTVDGNFTCGDTIYLANQMVHTGDTNTKIKFPTNDVITFETGGSEALRVDSSGRLLIGATTNVHSQTEKVQISSTTATAAVFLSRYADNANAAYIHFNKSRSGTIGGNTIVQDDDLLGRIYFQGNDGSSPQSAAYIEAHVDGTPGSTDMPGRLEFLTSADGVATPTERLRIDSSGNVTIRDAKQLLFENDAQNASSAILNQGASGTSNLVFAAGGSERARVSAAGSFAIGDATEPGAKLYVNGLSTNDVITARCADSNGASVINILSEGTTGISRIKFSDTAATDGLISYNHSDRRLSFAAAGTSPQAYLDSSGRFLIGTTTEGNANADNLTIADSSTCGISIRSGTTSTGNVYFSDATSGSGEFAGAVEYDHSSNSLRLHANSAETLRIISTGEVGIGITNPAKTGIQNNVKVLQLDGGDGAELILGNSVSANVSDNHIGAIAFKNIDNSTGSAPHYAGIRCNCTDTSGNMNLKFYAGGGGGTGFEDDTPDMLIDSLGSIGIGTDTPNFTSFGSNTGGIEISNVNTNNALLVQSGTNEFYFANTSSANYIWGDDGVPISIATSDTERMRIAADGEVFIGDGLGTSDRNTILSVSGANQDPGAVWTTMGIYSSDTYLENKGGSLGFGGQDGSTTKQQFAAISGVKENGTSGDYAGRLRFWTRPSSSVSLERLRITSAGHITVMTDDVVFGGIGTLRINSGSTSGALNLDGGATNHGGEINLLGGSNGGRIQFRTGQGSGQQSEKMRLDSNGCFQVGNELGTAHAGYFQVINTGGSGQTNDCLSFFETNAADYCIKTNFNLSSSPHWHMKFEEEGSTRGSIYGADGSNVTFQSGSDYRWKENIVDMTGTEGIDICKKLKPRKYNWIDNRIGTGQINTVDGFIAHEVEEAGVLGAVYGEKDAVNEDGSIKGQTVDYGQMTPVLAAAIKGLIDKVETLEAELSTLKSTIKSSSSFVKLKSSL